MGSAPRNSPIDFSAPGKGNQCDANAKKLLAKHQRMDSSCVVIAWVDKPN